MKRNAPNGLTWVRCSLVTIRDHQEDSRNRSLQDFLNFVCSDWALRLRVPSSMLRRSTAHIRPLSRVIQPIASTSYSRPTCRQISTLKPPAASSLLRVETRWRASEVSRLMESRRDVRTAGFHSTPRRQVPPFLIPLLAGVLKVR